MGVVSLQAVYDGLATLTDKRVIRRIQPAGSPVRYEDAVADNDHHLICPTGNRWSMSTALSARRLCDCRRGLGL